MVRWLRWHCPPDTGFEIRALAVWGQARYLSVTEAPHNTDFHTWMGKKHFCFFQTAETGKRTPDSGVKGSGANHYPRAPALMFISNWNKKLFGLHGLYEIIYALCTSMWSMLYRPILYISKGIRIPDCQVRKKTWDEHFLINRRTWNKWDLGHLSAHIS